MAGESKEILELSKHLIPVFNEMKNAARMMGEASEKLSNTGLDKFTEQIKKSLKSQALISESDADQIKDAKSLQKVLSKLEDQYEALHKLEKEAERIAKSYLGDAKKTKEQHEESLKIAREQIAAKYEEHDITLDMIDTLKKGIPLIRQETEAKLRNVSSADKLSKEFEGLTTSVKSQVASFFSLGAGLALFKKGVMGSYEAANRLTSRGMLGALTSLQAMSLKLFISAQDLEEIMNKNRDLINSMGGGVAGIEAFGDEISTVRQSLEYLGRDATKASARFIEMSKKAGLTPKDGVAYRKNLNSSIKQFEEFSGLFGDSYEDYANLMEQMNEEEETRKRLNVLSKTQLQLELEEIRQRTANLKLMGLSNQQIVEFNKHVQTLVNPRKNDFAQRATEAYATKANVDAMARILQKGGTPEDAKLLADLQASKASIEMMTNLHSSGRQAELAKFMESGEGIKAARAMSKAAARTDQADQFERAYRNNLIERGGSLWQGIDKGGTMAATAQAQDRDLTGKTPAELEALKTSAKEMVAVNSDAAKSLALLTKAVEGAKAILESPFLQAVTGAIVALWALAAAATASATAKSLGGMLGGKGGKPGAGGGWAGAGNKASKLGKAAGFGGKVLGAGVGGALAWSEVNDIEEQKKQSLISEREANRQSGGVVGGLAGAGAGMAFGAGVGSVVPGFGTVVGGLVGGVAGYFGGSSIGEKIGGQFGSDKTLEQQKAARQSSGKVSSDDNKPVSSGQNEIASIISSSPGVLIAKRPDGTTVKMTGTRAWRNNNPGNLEYNEYTKKLGAIGTDGRFAIFPDLKTGMKAKQTLLFEGKNYKDLTLSSAISRYAPSHENNTAAYQANILAAVGGENKSMNQYTPEQQSKIMTAMAQQEGFKPGNTELVGSAPQTAQTAQTAQTFTASTSEAELKKQTALLSQLVNNTMGNGRIASRPDSYMQDSATVLSGSAG